MYLLGELRRRDVMNPLMNKLFGVELMKGTLVQYRLGVVATGHLV